MTPGHEHEPRSPHEHEPRSPDEAVSPSTHDSGMSLHPGAQSRRGSVKVAGLDRTITQGFRQFAQQAENEAEEPFEHLPWTNGRAFHIVVSSLVVVNSIFLGLETDHYESGKHTGQFDPWYATNVAFTSLFCIELALRSYSSRTAFFKDPWNNFDSCLVLMSFIDTFILEVFANEESEVGVISVLRVLRIFRVLRMVRLLRFCGPLRLLVVGAIDATRALMWAWILITVVVYIFAIFLTRTVGFAHKADNEVLNDYFGNIIYSMFTLFQVITLEGWPSVARAAMKVEPWVWIVFVVFLLLTTFSIMNMIVSVIVDSTLEHARNEKLDLLHAQEAEMSAAVVKIDEIFKRADVDRNGSITKEELLSGLAVKEIQQFLQEVGVDLHFAEHVFDVIDHDGSGELDAREFSTGLAKARGDAKAQDVLAFQCDLWRREKALRDELQNLCVESDVRFSQVNDELDGLRQDLRALGEILGVS